MVGHDGFEPGVRDLAGEEVEEPLQLVGIPAERRRQLGRVGILGGLDRAHVELKLVAVALHAAEHAHGISLGEPAVEEVDVVPHAALDAAAGVDELEREVVGAARACGGAVCARRRTCPRRSPSSAKLGRSPPFESSLGPECGW